MSPGEPKRVLSLIDAVALVVGVVIGAGIFHLPGIVAAGIQDETLILSAWLLGGFISLIGALCFAELVTAHPHPGGEYHFLTRAYGSGCGFMFGWARMTVVQTGSIALLAYIFGDYASQLMPLGPYGPSIYAAGAVIILTALNLAGIRQTKTVQNLLFAATLIGLTCVIVTGFLLLSPAGPTAQPTAAAGETGIAPAALGLAMIFVLLTYGGWNEAAYISAEVRNPNRNLVRALVLSIGVITLFYFAINFVYLRVLGPTGMAESRAVASDVMRAAFGEAGGIFISVLILFVILASTNVTIFTGARTNFALGRDFPLFGFLAYWNERNGAPVTALLLQGAIALALILLATVSGYGGRGVEMVVDYLSPVFWFFFLLTGLSVLVLRKREPGTVRPFRVPFYPVTPILFCLTSAYLLYSSLTYTGIGALVGVAVLAAGLPLLVLARRATRRAEGAS